MIISDVKRFLVYNRNLSLDKKITNQVLLILSIIAFLSGITNSFISFTAYFTLIFYIAGLIALIAVYFNYKKNAYTFSKVLFLGVIYLMVFISWLYSIVGEGTKFTFTCSICEKGATL